MTGARSRRLPAGTMFLLAVLGLVLSGCGTDAATTASDNSTTVSSSTTASSTAVLPTETTSTAPPPPTSPTTRATPTRAAPTTPPPPAPPAAARGAPSELDRAGDARQVVLVTTADYGATTAALTTWQRTAPGAWVQVHGPWTARVHLLEVLRWLDPAKAPAILMGVG